MALIEIERPTAAHAVMEDVCDTIARRAQSGSVGTCPVELTDAFVSLSASQSCGKCVPCRVGLAQMRNLVGAILDGRASERDVDVLERTARNAYLSAEERQAALVLSRAIFAGKAAVEAGERDAAALKALRGGIIEAEPLARIDYVEVVDGVTMQPTDAIGAMALVAMAVYIGSTRLIDNFLYEEGE